MKMKHFFNNNRMRKTIIQVQIATIKSKLNFKYKSPGIRIVSQVSKQRKTNDLRKLGNIRKTSNLDEA